MPAGAFRGYGLPQSAFAVESAIDEVARAIGMDAFEFRRRNVVRPGDPMISTGEIHHDVIYGSYGLDQCLDLVDAALKDGSGDAPPSPDWLTGQGCALTMIDTIPPGGHFSDSTIALREDGGYLLTVGTAEFGNGTATVHQQIAATLLSTAAANVSLRTIRHRAWRPRYRRLWLNRHRRRRPRHRTRCRGAARHNPRFRRPPQRRAA